LSSRLFVDVTNTYNSGLRTGIQRVIRSLAKELSDLAADHGVEVFLVTCDTRNPRKHNLLSQVQFSTDDPQKNVNISADQFFSSEFFSPLERLSRRTKTLGFPKLLNSRFVKIIFRNVVHFLFLIYSYRFFRTKVKNVKFRKGDVLLLADAFWATPNFLSTTKQAKRRGAKIAVLIHDIIPITHPEFCDSSFVNNFTKMLPDVLSLADLLLYPSFYTRDQLVSSFFPSGINVPNKRILWGNSKNQVQNIYEDLPRRPNSIIMVGTLEPRKNHVLVLKWFLKLASPQIQLTVIGKSGWMNKSVTTALNRETSLNPNLRWIEDASDDDLFYEMSRHEVGLMASHVEGLGLPVLEYSNLGLKLVLSDIPVFREIAGDSAYFFDSTSIESLDEAIGKALANKNVSSVPEVLWKDTAREILIFLREELG
jgi:glycosyltransferase involved in cell wall biosynthesis